MAARSSNDARVDVSRNRFEDMGSDDEYEGPKYGFVSLNEAREEVDRLEHEIDEASIKHDTFAGEASDAAENADRWRRYENRSRGHMREQANKLKRYRKRLDKAEDAIKNWGKKKKSP